MTTEISAINLLELLSKRVKRIVGQIQRDDVKNVKVHSYHGVAALILDAITIELDREYLAQSLDLIPPREETFFEFSLRVHTNYRCQVKSGRDIQSNDTLKNLYILDYIRNRLYMNRVLDDNGNFLIFKLFEVKPNLIFEDSDSLGGGLKIVVQLQSEPIDYQSKLHTEPVSDRKNIFEHTDDYRYCKLTMENGKVYSFDFTSMQAEAVNFIHLSHKGMRPDIPQSKILEEIGSMSNNLKDVFRSCDKDWKKLIVKGNKRDCVRLNV